MKKNHNANTNGNKPGGLQAGKNDAATGFRKLFLNEIKGLYWAEKALVKAFPKLAGKAESEMLIKSMEEHEKETERHIARLEEIFAALGLRPEARKPDAMVGVLKEAGLIIEEPEVGFAGDAAILMACQKMEHYEIAVYETLQVFAQKLDEPKVASLLEETLREEREAADTFASLCDTVIRQEELNGQEEE